MQNNFWNQKRVLITGATGLVGSWLIKSLTDKNAYVVALIRDADPQSNFFRENLAPYTTIVNGALENLYALERAINEHEVDTVFHLGAQTIVGTALRNPLPTFEANIRGTYNLLECCRLHRSLVKRIVIASSDKAYGSSPQLPYTEEMPLKGEHPYDVSKSCTDLLALSYYHTYQLPIGIARCGNIYGGGDLNWSRIIPGTIKKLYNREAPEIRSNGLFTRDYIYVKDVVLAYLELAEQLNRESIQGEAFNFGPNQPYTVLDIVNRIQLIMGLSDIRPKILNQAQAEIKDQTLSSKKALELLSWEPTYSLNDGLKETIEWYKFYLDQHQREKNTCKKETAAFAEIH
jgi:CDP-glucose 4,6-dehydratase